MLSVMAFAGLVEQQGIAVGVLERAQAVSGGPGERAFRWNQGLGASPRGSYAPKEVRTGAAIRHRGGVFVGIPVDFRGNRRDTCGTAF